MWAWGYNTNAQLGDGTTAHKSSPVQTVGGGTNWKSISVGDLHTAAIKSDGTLWVWGFGTLGQLGDNTSTNKSSPVQTVAGGTNWKQASAGTRTSAAIKTDGSLWIWGYNNLGQLGNNTDVTNRSSPVQTICSGTNWKQVAAGYHVAAIKTDGTLWLWGWNNPGQLGNGTDITPKSSPAQTVAGGTNWKQVAVGTRHTAAVKTDGTLWTWGINGYGQLGDGTNINRSSPVQTIASGTNWKQVSCGLKTTVAIKTDGSLWTWGYNGNGELGDGTGLTRSSPVQTICSGTNWKQASTGSGNTTAIKTNGELWSWGVGSFGAVGDNGITSRSSPVQTIMSGTNWKQVSSGGYFSVAVKYDG